MATKIVAGYQQLDLIYVHGCSFKLLDKKYHNLAQNVVNFLSKKFQKKDSEALVKSLFLA